MAKKSKSAETVKTPLAGFRYSIHGRVQGVGFRDFAQREARKHQVTGYTRNLSDGSVLVCAVGTLQDLTNLEAALRQGPRWAEVRSFVMEEMETREFDDFRIVS